VAAWDAQLTALVHAYEAARGADVPSLAAVRRCSQDLAEFVERTLTLPEIDLCELPEPPPAPPRLRVIENDAPALSPPRGFCSPLKTDAVRRFEDLVRREFGDVDACAMRWETGPGLSRGPE
jgi:hypothetical protein